MARILLVEDDPTIQEVVATYLRLTGFEVTIAVDGIEACVLAPQAAPDLIVIDLGLPRLDGWLATEYLREDPATARLPIVALSAHVLEDDRRRAFIAGCNAFVAKPIDFTTLLATIDRLLARQAAA